MAYQASNIIRISETISASGLSTANFTSYLIFAPSSELPSSPAFAHDTWESFSSTAAIQAAGFPTTSETYKAAAKILGSTPATSSVTIYGRNSADTDWPTTLNKARNSLWWYWSVFTADVYASIPAVLAIAAWCETNNSAFMNCQTGTNATEIRTQSATDDICTQLNALGYRHTFTAAHATDAYAGLALTKFFAAVNYSGTNTTITGDYKKSPGVAAEDLTDTAYTAMVNKKCMFYTIVANDGSEDSGRWINTYSHSTYGEWMDDVVNLDSFVNAMRVGLYNTLTAAKKLPQTPRGQAVLLGEARKICKQFVANDYLGPRDYTNPDTGDSAYTVGYEILTDANDILDLSDTDRAARKAYPISIRLFRAGAIHFVDLDLTIY